VAYYTTAASSNGAAVYFEHQDWLGTERMRTSYNGNPESTFTSPPFGDSQTQTTSGGSDTDANHFAMLDYDSESNTDHAEFRQYSPTEGRWLAPDPYRGSYDFTNPQSFNRYEYAMNNPLSNIDPSGRDCYGVDENGSAFFMNSGDCPDGSDGIWVPDGATPYVNDQTSDLIDYCLGWTCYNPDGSVIDPTAPNTLNVALQVMAWGTSLDGGSLWDLVASSAYQLSGYYPVVIGYIPVEGIPIPVISGGITANVTFIPKTKTLCVGPAVGVATGAGKSLTATMYPSWNAAHTKDVIGEFGWTFSAQPNELAGVSVSSNSSGTLMGYSISTDTGASVAYGYNACADF
jgi:RHS repeat-associated protein